MMGRGASSTVYVAIHTSTQTPVALKVCIVTARHAFSAAWRTSLQRVSVQSKEHRAQLVSELKALVNCPSPALVTL